MLSQDIRNRTRGLRRALQERSLTLATLMGALDAFEIDAERAAALEASAIAPAARLDDDNLPDNVVRLAPPRRRAAGASSNLDGGAA